MYVKPETKSAEEIKTHIENLKKRCQEIRKRKQKNEATRKQKKNFRIFSTPCLRVINTSRSKRLSKATYSIKGCNDIDTMKMRISEMPRLQTTQKFI